MKFDKQLIGLIVTTIGLFSFIISIITANIPYSFTLFFFISIVLIAQGLDLIE